MSLNSGDRLGPYLIEAAAGAGGMGEVYKAMDTRLERTVAIKILPANLSANADLKTRFEREAKAISSLNHPNICTLYDVGHENGLDFLVMEFIEGETLTSKIEQGPLPTTELLNIAIQIADALDKAHRQGLVHRDLKPGNIMLTKDGAKLLDFGLAKVDTTGGVVDGTSGITRTSALTGQGTILGTLQYMAPEQLEGKEADSRSDIFAFGAVLYEMATGKRAFEGGSQASLIASIIKEEPRSISQVQPMAPPMLERAVSQCLAKDPDHRWQSAGDLKRALQWVAEGGSQVGLPALVAGRRKLKSQVVTALAAIASVVAVVLAVLYFGQTEPEPTVLRFSIEPPEEIQGINWPSISPDGKLLSFLGRDSSGTSRIWIRPLNSLDAYPLPGSEGVLRPFWSPDSKYLAFFAGTQLKKIPAAGGPAQIICEAEGADGNWGKGGMIIYDNNENDSIKAVPSSGGTPVAVTEYRPGDHIHAWPWFLPDGKHFFYIAESDSSATTSESYMLHVGSVDNDDDKFLFSMSTRPVFDPAGYILYTKDGTLLARKFDAGNLEVVGDPIPVATNVVVNQNVRSNFSISDNGILVYEAGQAGGRANIVEVDRKGTEIEVILENNFFGDIRLSPDDKRLAYQQQDRSQSNSDLWVRDLKRNVSSRLTLGDKNEVIPVWSPDGSQIAYGSDTLGAYKIFQIAANGLGGSRLIYGTDSGQVAPVDWSPDGKSLLATLFVGRTTDLWQIKLGDSVEAINLTSTPQFEWRHQFSPDGNYIVYQSNETGDEQIFILALKGSGGKWQVSANGGQQPRWRADGRELFFVTGDGGFMAVDIDLTQPEIGIGMPHQLFNQRLYSGGLAYYRYDVSNDGQKFFMVVPEGDQGSQSKLNLIYNWSETIRE